MAYDILLTERAVKDLQKMDDSNEERVRNRIRTLEDNPDHFGKPLKGPASLWVLKVGQSDWRAVYRIKEGEEQVVVLAVGHRRNVYEEFP